MHVFGQWEEARIPRENMQIPHRRNSSSGFKPRTFLLRDATYCTTMTPKVEAWMNSGTYLKTAASEQSLSPQMQIKTIQPLQKCIQKYAHCLQL